MTVSRKTWANLLCSCLLLCSTGAVLGQFKLEPVNVTKLQGSDAQFNATVQGTWTYMTWTMGGLLVLTMPADGKPTSFSEQFSAQLYINGSSSRVTFTVHNVTRKNSGPVICTVQGVYGSRTSQLYVHESGSVSILGGDRSVKQDEQVEFQCRTTGWFPAATISWMLKDQTVNSSLVNTTSVTNGDSYNSTSVLQFQAVRNTTVTCLATVAALQDPLYSSVQLTVVPKPTDWTVLIAIVVSFSSFALLVLLIIGIIFCCKRRKEKEVTYQDEMMRQRTQSQLSARPTAQSQGQVNPVFVIDGTTGVGPSEFQTNGSPFYERPALENSHQEGRKHNDLVLLDFPKHRHVTIV